MDESSLSEHEQRILQEIERSLAAEDPGIERRLRQADPHRDKRLLRLGVVGLLAGLVLMLGFTRELAYGVVGFLVMLGSAVAIGTAVRQMSSAARPSVRSAWKRAEDRMRPRRKDS